MKLHAQILGVVAAAVLAPGAVAAADGAVGSGHVTSHGASATYLRAQRGGTRANTTVPSQPLYIYQRSPLAVPAVDPSYACASAATDCTAEEACELWGTNCVPSGAPVVGSADGSVGAASTDSTANTPNATGR